MTSPWLWLLCLLVIPVVTVAARIIAFVRLVVRYKTRRQSRVTVSVPGDLEPSFYYSHDEYISHSWVIGSGGRVENGLYESPVGGFRSVIAPNPNPAPV